MVPFVWYNEGTGNNTIAIFNRGDGSAFDRQTLKASIAGATGGVYPY